MVRRRPTSLPQVANINPELPGLPLRERGLEARIVYVTPALAREWLTINAGNRKLNAANLRKIGRDMAAGSWHLTGEPIIFDRLGALRNGQHRLTACDAWEAPFSTVVIWGIEPEAFRAIDRGAGRTIANVLQIEGEVNASELSAVASMVWRADHGLLITSHGGGSAATADEIIDTVERHPEIRDSISWASGAKRVGITPRVGVYAHYELARVDKGDADLFFEQFYDGAALASGDPILVLRNQLAGGAVKGDPLRQYAWIVTAWNHWRDDKSVKQIRWSGPKLPQPE